jgi:hypothetical protein
MQMISFPATEKTVHWGVTQLKKALYVVCHGGRHARLPASRSRLGATAAACLSIAEIHMAILDPAGPPIGWMVASSRINVLACVVVAGQCNPNLAAS